MSVRIRPLLLFLSVLLVYVNTLNNSLFWDDEDFIYRNEYVKGFALPKFFTENVISGAGKISNYYRPILLTSFAINYQICQKAGFCYHLASLLFHAGSAIFLFLVLLRLFDNKALSLLTSLFFALHPIQTEAVAYASGAGDPLFLLLGLASIYVFLKGRMVVSLVLFILSLLAKELAMTVPLLLVLADVTVKKRFNLRQIRQSVLCVWPFFLTLFFYWALRLTILNFQNTLNFYGEANVYTETFVARLFTFAPVFFTYLLLLIFPLNLHMERSTTILTTPNISVLAFLLTLIVLLAVFILALRRKIFTLIFALVWFFTTLLPVSGIVPINGILYEHFLYVPMIGFFLAVSQGMVLLIERTRGGMRLLCIFIVCILLILFSVRTIIRNEDWSDPITFYRKTLSFSDSLRVRQNLAMSYADVGQYEKAVAEFKKVIETADVYPNPHHNLANVYLALGKREEAKTEYERAIAIDPTFFFSYDALINLYLQEGKREEAIEWIRKRSLLSP